MKDLKENGRQISVTEANKREYVQLACQMKMTESIKAQIKSFLEGFYEIIPKDLIAIFNEQELELLISGLPTIDIDDLKANTEYRSYQENSLQVGFRFQSATVFAKLQYVSMICVYNSTINRNSFPLLREVPFVGSIFVIREIFTRTNR